MARMKNAKPPKSGKEKKPVKSEKIDRHESKISKKKLKVKGEMPHAHLDRIVRGAISSVLPNARVSAEAVDAIGRQATKYIRKKVLKETSFVSEIYKRKRMHNELLVHAYAKLPFVTDTDIENVKHVLSVK
ncbi:MAG TPA: hypothetical protein VEF04_03350 [Blastocatellia bacterium]|nr:hypothetical protein [Blastocatellia bacterium]